MTSRAVALGLALASGSCVAAVDEPPGADGAAVCAGTSRAHDTFNAFWSVFDEHYAVFDVRLVDESWDAVGRAGCANVSADMTDAALYDVLLGMAQELDDGHITLTADSLGRDDDAEVSVYPNDDAVEMLEDLVESAYLDGSFTTAAENEISWGTVGTIGYVSITSMDELSASGDEDDDVAAAAAAMAKVMADLADKDAIVV
ncbi:MAG TPA: hypothetical protein VIV11_14610, partial [Kofleriaceae bacterium]